MKSKKRIAVECGLWAFLVMASMALIIALCGLAQSESEFWNGWWDGTKMSIALLIISSGIITAAGVAIGELGPGPVKARWKCHKCSHENTTTWFTVYCEGCQNKEVFAYDGQMKEVTQNETTNNGTRPSPPPAPRRECSRGQDGQAAKE